MYMSDSASTCKLGQKKPRAQRRRYCRKCSELHFTTGYMGSLWYCVACAEALTVPEATEYITSREVMRAEINKNAGNYLFIYNK